jgi:3-methyladenine DNA glycosylase AlkC
MAEPLKAQYGPEIPRRLAASLVEVWPEFPEATFLREALDGYEALELLPRGRHLATVLARFLPPDFDRAVDILLDSLGKELDHSHDRPGIAPFFYMPHAQFVADHGVTEKRFETAMRAQHAITRRFTAEFSMRPFLQAFPDRTLACLHEWVTDPSEDVRRLCSECTRPRLPWASRLPAFQQDPTPVVALLERLKDDPSLYVRRSVANNLNDIGKDHPALLAEIAGRWLDGATPEREWVVRHALRTAVKRGETAALAVLGFGRKAEVALEEITISPSQPRLGEAVTIAFVVRNQRAKRQAVLVDFAIHFVKHNGSASPKVFKLKQLELSPGERVAVRKKVSLAELSTRRHYPGKHRVEVLLNGEAQPLGSFDLRT